MRSKGLLDTSTMAVETSETQSLYFVAVLSYVNNAVILREPIQNTRLNTDSCHVGLYWHLLIELRRNLIALCCISTDHIVQKEL